MATFNDSDASISANGDIRWTGATTTYNTVLEFHRWLMDKADDAVAAGDDLMDITFPEPSDRSTDNIITLLPPYNIDDTMAHQLYDGSITQDGGDTLYSGLEVKGVVRPNTELVIIQDNKILTSWWGDGSVMINDDTANLIILRTLIKVRSGGVDIDGKKILLTAREFGDTYVEFPVTLGLGNATGAISTETDLNNTTAEATVNSWSITNTEGYQTIDLNNGNGAQPYYSQWNRDVQSINELYEFIKDIQRRGTAETIHTMNGALFRGITHQFGYDAKTGTVNENDVLAWGTKFTFDTGVGTFLIDEPVKFSPSGATGQIRYYSGAGATGTMIVAVDANSGTVTTSDSISTPTGGSGATCNVTTLDTTVGAGGTGIILADDTTSTVWIQLLTGSAPVDNLVCVVRGGVVTNKLDVNGSVTSRSIRPVFLGQSTGLAIIGAFGIGVEATDLTTADTLTDLLNVTQSPPNNQTWTASGLTTGEDRVLVALNDGSDEIDYSQFTLASSLTSATTTSVQVNEAIPTWIPKSGGSVALRIKNDNNIYIRCTITDYNTTTKTFTISSTDFSVVNATLGNNAFVAVIDLLATGSTATFRGIYTSDISLVVKSRDGGVTPEKPFRVPSTFNSGGGGTIIQHVSDA